MAAAVLLLGAAAYTAWVLELVLATGLDPVRAYVSELAAADQPLGGLFRATDLAAGLLVLAGALTAMTAPAGRASAVTTSAVTTSAATAPLATAPAPVAARTAKAGWVALAVFGAATAVDSRLPLSCAPTSDPVCAARETAGLVPATHTAHAVSSTCAMLGALAALVLLTAAARRHDRRAPLARYGPWLVLAELAATCWTLASVAAFSAGRGTWALGAGQRLQVLLVALYLALLALHLARPDRAARTEPVTEAKEIPHR
ncbi:DUF998 domain-containing protein [Streptomyces endophytica]|uniref:DUF998 domain-containing protein n=1 Tax=Streptomyces endophytica TaxID=2991496 RepID=A0ABY6PJJ8_9ACTN|nr:DUF998 domain-containing protein [Streptomyces endophytica]UZJ34065.1 DUF998 domain-containing protein [Streptomyces endophytica]